MRTRWLVAAALVVGVPVALAARYQPDLAVRVATGFVAHDVCSKTFVSKLDAQTAFADIVTMPGIRALRWGLRIDVDRSDKAVTASLLGSLGSRAVFHEGLGCVVVRDGSEPYLPRVDFAALRAPARPPLLPEIAGAAVVEPSDPKLKSALDHAFEEPATPPLRLTKAVVVVHDGQVIAERYAPDVGIDTPLLGFSMTKSVISALIGILTQQGLTSPSLPAPVPEWRGAKDPRSAIEVEHLLRMSTGLALDELNSGFDPASRMYLHDDMAAFAAEAPMIAKPGTRWAYSSPSTQLLARLIRDAVGGPEQALKFAWRELFNPLGMRDVVWELDGSGTLQGASYLFASARDWARFGLLYLNDGMIGGQRILHADWVDFSARATLDSDYGAGFFTNRSAHPNAQGRAELGIPRDAFFASGSLGQRIVILPTQRLVIVRLGHAVDPTGDMRGLARLVGEVIAALGTAAK